MYRYPKDFFRPPMTTVHPRRRVSARPAPEERRTVDRQPASPSPRPARTTPPTNGQRPARVEDIFEQPAAPVEEAPEQPPVEPPTPPADGVDWKRRALELQAEMDNFRKRQQRRAEESIAQGKERLLARFLAVADNLERALAHADDPAATLHQGVELTHRELMRILDAENVSRMETIGQPFDPTLHEALAALPTEAEPETIIEEVEAGYTLGDKLLRPAKVVVAAE